MLHHQTGSQLPPSCPTPGARTAPPARCGSQQSFDGCLTSASSYLQRAILYWWLEITPASMTPPGARWWWQLVVILCSPPPVWLLAPRGHGQDTGTMRRRKTKGARREGASACPATVRHGGTSPACGICADPACAEATLQRCPSCCLYITLLLSCTWLGSAIQFSPSKCLGGSGG